MKYIAIVTLSIITLSIIGLLLLSGCVSKKDTNEDLTANIDNADNQNKSLDNADNQISSDLSGLDTTSEDPEIQQIDKDLKDLDSLLQEEDPLAGLN